MRRAPAQPPPSLTGRLTRWLSGLPVAALFAAFLAWFSAWSVFVLVALEHVVTTGRQREMASVAGPLMPAIGALFAFLTAFVIATEWTQHRDAERNVGEEADAALRFGLTSRWPGFAGAGLRAQLCAYLDSVIADEWPGLGGGNPHPTTTQHLAAFERDVRDALASAPLPQWVASDLLGSADDVALTRADRIQAARQELPPALFVLATLSGIVLNLNAIALALRLEGWVGIVIGGLVVVIALDLALVVAIGAPFRGSLRVDSWPLVHARETIGDSTP